MGYYTEFHCKTILRKDTPDDVVLLISHMIYDHVWGEDMGVGSWHRLFTLERWELIFMTSAFLDSRPRFIRKPNGYYELELHCDINYGNQEIKEFIKWISPYVAGRKKRQYIGQWRGETMDLFVNEYVER